MRTLFIFSISLSGFKHPPPHHVCVVMVCKFKIIAVQNILILNFHICCCLSWLDFYQKQKASHRQDDVRLPSLQPPSSDPLPPLPPSSTPFNFLFTISILSSSKLLITDWIVLSTPPHHSPQVQLIQLNIDQSILLVLVTTAYF